MLIESRLEIGQALPEVGVLLLEVRNLLLLEGDDGQERTEKLPHGQWGGGPVLGENIRWWRLQIHRESMPGVGAAVKSAGSDRARRAHEGYCNTDAYSHQEQTLAQTLSNHQMAPVYRKHRSEGSWDIRAALPPHQRQIHHRQRRPILHRPGVVAGAAVAVPIHWPFGAALVGGEGRTAASDKIVPPLASAASNAASVQLAGVPLPTTPPACIGRTLGTSSSAATSAQALRLRVRDR
jgi:hypothetical protein